MRKRTASGSNMENGKENGKMKKSDYDNSFLSKYTLRQYCSEELTESDGAGRSRVRHKKQQRKPKSFER